MNAGNIRNALFLAKDENLLSLDRKVLRASHVQQGFFFNSGRKALEHLVVARKTATGNGLHEPPVALIVCHERLSDMTGLQFLASLRENPLCSSIPVLFLTGNAGSATTLAAAASNSCAVLTRPYSAEAAANAVERSMLPTMQKAPFPLPPSCSETFGRQDTTLASTRKPILGRPARKAPPGEIALREGLVALQRNELDTAAKFLTGSYAADPLCAETCLALAKLAQKNADEEARHIWIARASSICLRKGDTAKGREILSRLPKGKSGQVPLLRVASEELQRGEIKAAALSFMEAERLCPGQGLHAFIGRACMFTPAPEESIRHLVKALASSGHESTAARLHSRLLRESRVEEDKDDGGFLTRFPVLQDIVTVASHTFKTWRHAA